jgi:hypothetical protein
MKTLEIPIHPLGEPWAPEILWKGMEDPKSIEILRSPRLIRISVHSMMVSAIGALVELDNVPGVNLTLSCPSSTSPRHILSLSEEGTPYDVLITADAGVYTSALNITKNFRRVFTVWEETHLAIGMSRNAKIKQVLVVPGTTQEIHHKLAADDGRFPKQPSEVIDIENLFIRAKEIQPSQLILLTYPKAQRILRELQFKTLDSETRGMTFGLYLHRELSEAIQVAFLRAFVAAYNLCKWRFEDPTMDGIDYRRNLLRRMAGVIGFLNNYGFGTFAEVRPKGFQ